MSDGRDELERRRRELSADKRELLARRLRGERTPVAPPAGIPRRAPGTPTPLSLPQQRLWFLDQLAPGSSTYNEPAAVRLSGPLDEAALRRSLDELVRRHEILRTRFVVAGDEPRQDVVPAAPLPLTVVDVDGETAAARQDAVMPQLLADAARPFDLARGPLLRATLYRLGRDQAILLLAMHHIVCDGWSMAVLMRELGELYAAALERRAPRLVPLAIQYGDFAAWQRRPAADAELAAQLAYWDRQLAGTLQALTLPFGRPPPRTPTGRGGTLSLAMPDGLRRALVALGRAHEATLFMMLAAGFSALLHRYTGAADLLLATPSANRNRVELEALVGFFVNTLVLRVDAANDPSFAELLDRVKASCVGAFSHEEVPFERLVERHRPERDARPPLAQIELAQQPPLPASLAIGALRMEPIAVPRTSAKFDQEWHFWESDAGLEWLLVYDGDLFDAEALRRMFGHLETLLGSACADPRRRLSELELLTAAERRRLVVEWNATAVAHPFDRTVSALIAEQAARTPGAIAVSDAAGALDYRALGERVGDRARRLAAASVGRDRIVALLAPRDVDFLVHVLAVLEAGGAYLPLDPRHPPARLAQVLEQSRVPLLVCADAMRAAAEAALAALPPGVARPQLLTFAELATAPARDSPLPAGAPGDLAYVIYTSGSTGVPKGAMVEQRGMVNHLFAKIADLGLGAGDCVAQNASQCFDISVWQLLSALLVGGRTHIVGDDEAHDPVALLGGVLRQGVTVLEVVPSMLRAILEELESRPRAGDALRWLLSTGEALPPELARRWLRAQPEVPLVNAYGPTECSDDVTHHIMRTPPTDAASQLPIGKPIANTQIYVLDAQRQLVPAGFLGEIYVGGVGVGRGYLHRPDLTERAFVPDPFASLPGARMYRTGDLGRHLPDGALEYLGRIDHQVKVRGYRIELGDLEAALERLPGVKAAAALAAPDARGETRLVAYVVSDGERGDPAELRRALGEVLPSYMVPSVIVPLAALPLNANGKLDRTALPPPPSEPDGGERTARLPRTPLEIQLAAAWSAVLGVERLGVDDDFFAIGGHSLLATRLVARLRDALGRDVPLRLVFEAPTIAEMASALAAGDGAAATSAFDPRADVSLADDIAVAPAPATTPPGQLLLTGATGFFGAWLVRALVDDTDARVVCVVRADDDAGARARLERHLGALGLWDERLAARVLAVAGDLAKPRLGLDEPRWATLAGELDAVVHNGALVNFALPYARLRDANVLGTVELVRLAAERRKKPLHFVSTLDVHALGEVAAKGDVAALATGYAQTKWVGEAIVLAAARGGLPVSIYRAGLLVGDVAEGRWTSDDFAKRLLLATVRLGAAPEVDLPLDLTPVDFASRALVKLAARGAGGIFHLTNPQPVSWLTLVNWLVAYGYRIDRLAADAWLARLRARGDIDPVFVAVVEMLRGGSIGPALPAIATEMALAAVGLRCPRVDQALVARYVERFIRDGLLPPPGAPGSG